ncbi:MAG: TonB family protein [Rhodanobacteraceae bacterium]
MAELPTRMLLGVTLALAFVLLARTPARRVFGAVPAFTLWLLPVLLALAPLLPRQMVPPNVWTMPVIVVTAQTVFTATHEASGVSWIPALISLWLIGAAIALCRLSLHYARSLRGLAPMPADWGTKIANVAPELDQHHVRVHAAGPAVLWAWRTRVLLPPDFLERFDPGARRLILRHEMTHARRGDALWLLLAEFACATLWFHPLAWLALPRFRLDQELACDERTLRSLEGDTSHYARTLLQSAATQPLPALIPWLAEPQLKERIAMISNGRPGALRRRAGFFAVAGLLCGGLLISGGQMPVQAAQTHASESIPPSADITYKNRFPPSYPAEALAKREQGKVVLDVTVDAQGNVQGVQVDSEHSAASQELRQAAMAAATHWKFNPGMQNGKPAGGTIEIPVNFALNPDAGTQCPAEQIHDTKPPFRCVSRPSATTKSS